VLGQLLVADRSSVTC